MEEVNKPTTLTWLRGWKRNEPQCTCAVRILFSQVDKVTGKRAENSGGDNSVQALGTSHGDSGNATSPFLASFPPVWNKGFGQERGDITPCVTFWGITSWVGDGGIVHRIVSRKNSFLCGFLTRTHDCCWMWDALRGSQREAAVCWLTEEGLGTWTDYSTSS